MATNKTIDSSELEQELTTIFTEFKAGVDKNSERAVRKVGKETAEELKTTSPRRTHNEKHYADGWKSRVEKDGYGGTTSRVYNTTKPSLTHLLEFGHGGPAPAKAYPHINPAYQKGAARLEVELKK